MITQTFEVENIKCGGCMNTIRKGLEHLDGVGAARPDNQTGTVEVEYDDALIDGETIAHKLASMGYPLAGENNLGLKAVSFVSCMVGRLNNE